MATKPKWLPTAGSFDIDRSSSATTTQSWDWIAIGTKP